MIIVDKHFKTNAFFDQKLTACQGWRGRFRAGGDHFLRECFLDNKAHTHDVQVHYTQNFKPQNKHYTSYTTGTKFKHQFNVF